MTSFEFGVHFPLTAHLNCDWLHFKCSIATMWVVAAILDAQSRSGSNATEGEGQLLPGLRAEWEESRSPLKGPRLVRMEGMSEEKAATHRSSRGEGQGRLRVGRDRAAIPWGPDKHNKASYSNEPTHLMLILHFHYPCYGVRTFRYCREMNRPAVYEGPSILASWQRRRRKQTSSPSSINTPFTNPIWSNNRRSSWGKTSNLRVKSSVKARGGKTDLEAFMQRRVFSSLKMEFSGKCKRKARANTSKRKQ